MGAQIESRAAADAPQPLAHAREGHTRKTLCRLKLRCQVGKRTATAANALDREHDSLSCGASPPVDTYPGRCAADIAGDISKGLLHYAKRRQLDTRGKPTHTRRDLQLHVKP